MKWLGEKGIGIAGLLGGLVSSLAVMSYLAERSKIDRKISITLAWAAILASGIMFIRVLIEIFVVNPTLFVHLVIPIGLLAVITGLFCAFLYFRTKQQTKGKIELSSPLKLKKAIKFGFFFAAILALIKIANTYFDTEVIYVVSFLSGLVNLDAITLSLSQLANDGLMQETAKNGIIIAILTNLVLKGGIAYYFGSKEFRETITAFFIFLIVIGIGLMFVF